MLITTLVLCQKTPAVERSPFLCPLHYTSIAPTLSPKPPSQKRLICVLRWFQRGVSSTHDALPQVFKTVSRMMVTIEAEVKVFSAV